MLTRESCHPLLDGIKHIGGRLVFPEGMSRRLKFRKMLARTGYDTVIDLQNNFASRWLTTALKPERIFRYRRARLNRTLRIYFPRLKNRIRIPEPVPLGYLRSVSKLAVTDDKRGLELGIDADWLKSAKSILASYHENAGLPIETVPLIISPGARHFTKMWQTERWVDLLKLCYQHGFTSQVVIGGIDDMSVAAEIMSGLNHVVLAAAGKTTLGEMTALLSLGNILVTGDSGPMHVAAAVRTPVVAIFGPTVPEFGFAPFRCQSRIVQIDNLECRPCAPHGSKICPRGHFRCMTDISVDMVADAIHSLTGVPDRKAAGETAK